MTDAEHFPTRPGIGGRDIDARPLAEARWRGGPIQVLGCPRCRSDRVDGDTEGACWCDACDLLFWDSNGVDLAPLGESTAGGRG